MEGRENEAYILGQYSCHIPGHEEIRCGLYSEYDFCECTKIKVLRTYNNGRSSNVAVLRVWSFHDISTMEYVGMQWNSLFNYWNIPRQGCSEVLFYVICKTCGYVLWNVYKHHTSLCGIIYFCWFCSVSVLFVSWCVCAYKQIYIDTHMILRKRKGKCKEITGDLV